MKVIPETCRSNFLNLNIPYEGYSRNLSFQSPRKPSAYETFLLKVQVSHTSCLFCVLKFAIAVIYEFDFGV